MSNFVKNTILAVSMVLSGTNANAVIDDSDVNNFSPNLVTLSAQQLEAKLQAYNAADNASSQIPSAVSSSKAVTLPGKTAALDVKPETPDINDPEFMRRVQAGDLSAITELANQQRKQHGLPAVNTESGAPSSVSQKVLAEKGAKGANPKLSGAIGQAMSMVMNPNAAAQPSGLKSKREAFPVTYSDAQDAVSLLLGSKNQSRDVRDPHRVKSVLINKGNAVWYNVVDERGLYSRAITPIDEAFEKQKAIPARAGQQEFNDIDISNAPTGRATEAAPTRVHSGEQADVPAYKDERITYDKDGKRVDSQGPSR